MAEKTTDLFRAKRGVAILATCIVQTLHESDPDFEERFLKKLTEAYYELKDNSHADPREELELLSLTRELLTGFSVISGQGTPFLSR